MSDGIPIGSFGFVIMNRTQVIGCALENNSKRCKMWSMIGTAWSLGPVWSGFRK